MFHVDGVDDLDDIFHPYLERIYQDVMIARCAGKHAAVGSLHYNRLVSFNSFKETMLTHLNEEHKIISMDLAKRFPDTTSPHIKHGDHLDDLIRDYWNETELNSDNIRLVQLMIELRNKALFKNESEPSSPLIPNERLMHDLAQQRGNFNVIYGPPGYGKTIHLRQFAERFIYEQRANNGTTLPLFFKATHLSEALGERATKESCWATTSMKITLTRSTRSKIKLNIP